MTAQELKNSILQLAVEGKLIIDNGELKIEETGASPVIASKARQSTEETGAELLERIRTEKAKLITEGKISGSSSRANNLSSRAKSRDLPPITENEKPFDIPENWCWCRLGEIFSHCTGKALNQSDKDGTLLEYITTSNMYWDHFELENLKKMYFTDNELEKCTIRKGDLLVCEGGEIGRTAIWDKDYEMRIQNHIHKLRPYFVDGIEIKFYYFVMMFYKNTNLISGKGIGIQGLSSSVLHNLKIPLPPLAEQKAIVAKIEELLPYIEKYDAAYTKLRSFNKKFPEDMQKSILQQAVQGKLVPQDKAAGNAKDLLAQIKAEKEKLIAEGKIKKEKALAEITEDEIPFEIPEHWCWCRLGEIVNLFTGNSINETEKIKNYTNLKDGYNYIATKDVSFEKEIDYNNGIKIPFEKENFRIAHKESPLMCIEGGSAGRKIGFLEEDVCFGNKLCVFESYIKGYSKYVYYYLQSPMFTDIFKSNLNGIIGGVSVNKLKTLLIPLPPLAEQKAIVEKIEELLPLCKKLIK